MKDDQTAAAQSSDRGIRQRVRRIAEARMMAEDRARFEAGFIAGHAAALSDRVAVLRRAAEILTESPSGDLADEVYAEKAAGALLSLADRIEESSRT